MVAFNDNICFSSHNVFILYGQNEPKAGQGEPINVERQLCCLSIRTAVLNPAYKYVTGIFVKLRDRKRARHRC